jgi:hypothetical protein
MLAVGGRAAQKADADALLEMLNRESSSACLRGGHRALNGADFVFVFLGFSRAQMIPLPGVFLFARSLQHLENERHHRTKSFLHLKNRPNALSVFVFRACDGAATPFQQNNPPMYFHDAGQSLHPMIVQFLASGCVDFRLCCAAPFNPPEQNIRGAPTMRHVADP